MRSPTLLLVEPKRRRHVATSTRSAARGSDECMKCHGRGTGILLDTAPTRKSACCSCKLPSAFHTEITDTHGVFVSSAHSFRQQARLAITLAWVAGYTNIVALLACGTVTSHMSGAASFLGRNVVEGKWNFAGLELFLLATFLAGATIAGLVTEVGRRRGWESIYVLPMAIEALLLALFAIGLELTQADPSVIPVSLEAGNAITSTLSTSSSTTTAYILVGTAACAMGLQNATITRISSGVVRTTHVTGVLTDIGLELVATIASLRSRTALLAHLRTNASARRLALLCSIIASFALGAALGTLVYDKITTKLAMFPPVLFLIWIILQDVRRPIAEIEASQLVAKAGLDLPDALGVYHLANDMQHGVSIGEHGAKKAAKLQRLPDLVAWLDRIPEHVQVIVLDLTDVEQLEDEAGFQIRAAVVKLHEQGKHLILAGVGNEQYQQLRRAGAGGVLNPENACPDLELAIARGLGTLNA